MTEEEKNETGESRLREIVKHGQSSVFNDDEKRFIREVRETPYWKLSKYQKTIVVRLYGWLMGQ